MQAIHVAKAAPFPDDPTLSKPSRNSLGARRGSVHHRERMERFMETGNPQTGALIVEMIRHRHGDAE